MPEVAQRGVLRGRARGERFSSVCTFELLELFELGHRFGEASADASENRTELWAAERPTREAGEGPSHCVHDVVFHACVVPIGNSVATLTRSDRTTRLGGAQDDLHGAAALGTAERVGFVDAADELGPAETSACRVRLGFGGRVRSVPDIDTVVTGRQPNLFGP